MITYGNFIEEITVYLHRDMSDPIFDQIEQKNLNIKGYVIGAIVGLVIIGALIFIAASVSSRASTARSPRG